MKIEAADIDVSKLLKTGIIVIPRFQRPYSWRNENIKDFWNDITESGEGDYFIGSMVMYSMGRDNFGVVDGQQRLSTITILLCVIRDFFESLGEHELALGVHNYIETRDRDNVKSFILKTETSFPYFQDRIQNFSDPDLDVEPREEEIRLQKAYDSLKKCVDGYLKSASSAFLTPAEKRDGKVSALKKLREIVFSLKVIKIELDDEDDAYVIFETLNTRGQDLALSDLIKNALGSVIKSNGNVDALKIKWADLTKNISNCGESVKLDTFFVHSWSSRFEAVTKQKAFKAFKDYLNKSISDDLNNDARAVALSHLSEFCADSDRYHKIYQPNGAFKKFQYAVSDSLVALRTFNVEQQTPYVLSLLRAYETGIIGYRALRKALRIVENFHFKFNAITSQRSSGSISSIYSRAARNLYASLDGNAAGVVIAGLRDELRGRLPSFEQFRIGFRDLSYSPQGRSNALVRYVLKEISAYEKISFEVDSERLTIEHVHPQSPSLDHNDIVSDELINNIGNLILISSTRNDQLANMDFSAKKVLFAQWPSCVPSLVSQSETWGAPEIEARLESMASVAYHEIWTI